MIADLHIHSKYAQATSKNMDLAMLEKWAKVKGVDLLGTGDFTHPKWIEELKSNLSEDGSGVLKTKSDFPFILQTEISLMYSQDGKGRRIHNLVMAPNFEVVDQITKFLLSRGRIDYDGRPIFGMSCIDFVQNLMDISKDIIVIPAHIWTPFFGLLGSKTGFDSIEECYQDLSKYIYGYETGLSSDPAMNWRVAKLDKYLQLSFSDLHSYWPWRMSREATVFDIDLSYNALLNSLKNKENIVETIEVDPGYGKYHFDGHRNCGVVMDPKESAKINSICPNCKKPFTIGVQARVDELADRPEGFVPKNAIPFKKLIPLTELIAAIQGGALATKKNWATYNHLLENFKSEYDILLYAKQEDLQKVADQEIVNAILANREGKIKVTPGYDGVYGVPILGKNKPEKVEPVKSPQTGLTDF